MRKVSLVLKYNSKRKKNLYKKNSPENNWIELSFEATGERIYNSVCLIV